MAEFKLNNLETEIRNKFLNRQLEDQIEIVGDRLSSFTKGYRVNVNTDGLGDAIKGIVDQIMLVGDEGAKEIVGNVVKNALNAMFSGLDLEESQQQLYTIVFSGVALESEVGDFRLPLKIWSDPLEYPK